MGFAYSWDFGIRTDLRELMDRRYDHSCPFETYEGLWDRLEARRERLQLYRYPSHELIRYNLPDDHDDDQAGDLYSPSIRPARAPSPSSSISSTSSQIEQQGAVCLRRVRARLL